jgi:undecaprenyl-diphosphatase
MDIIQSIVLGVVQGLTEFLPISSSGHLVLLQELFGIKNPPIFFDTILHLGTLVAVAFYLRKEIIYILKTITQKETIRLILFLILATIPAVIAGLFLQDKMEEIFSSIFYVGIFFLLTSVILFATRFFQKQTKDFKTINWFDALFIGVFQAVAILPGVSRSGSTISASIFRNMEREAAFKFSFLMSIPVIFGAFVLQLTKQHFQFFNGDVTPNIIGFLFAMIFGFVSLKIIEKVLIKGKLHYFAYYCLVLGLIVLIFIH